MSNAVVSSTTPNGPLVNSNGTATYAFIKWMQNIGNLINGAFDVKGQYQGDIGPEAAIAGRKTLASIVQFIDTGGVVTGPGVDFARAYLNKDTDHIGDGTGSPLAGGKAAYIALVDPLPTEGQTLRYDGAGWQHVPIAVGKPAVSHQWLNRYDDATGEFASSQPAFSDVSGVATADQVPPLSSLHGMVTAGQVPNLSLLNGQITNSQLPASGLSVTITTAALTPGGTQGSMTFTHGILTAQTPAT